MTSLQMLIEDRRKKMFEIATNYGFTSEQTIECSQQLDRLINLLMLQEQNKKD